jgi:hypothetical protein
MAKKSAAPPAEAPTETTPPEAQAPPVAESPPDTTTAATPTTPAETPPVNPLLEKFSAAGFEGVDSIETGAQRALELANQRQAELEALRKEYEQSKPFIEYGQRYFEQQQTTPPPAAETTEEPKGWWQPPAVDMRLVNYYQETKTNPATNEQETAWKPNTPQNIKDAYDAHQLYQQEWINKIAYAPHEALAPFREDILDEAVRRFEKMYGTRTQQQTAEQFLSSFERDNADWLFSKDPLTQKPLTSQLDPQADEWFREAQEELGITDPQKLCQYVLKQHQRSAPPPQPSTPAPSAAELRDQKKRDITSRNAATPPNRNGTAPPADSAAEQNRNLSLSKKLAQAFREDGVTFPAG